MTYRIPGSTVFFAEGFPLDITDPELENFLYYMEEQFQIGVDHNRTKSNIRQQINLNTTTTRLPNNLFGTIIYMAPDAATFTYGFHHGHLQRLALRLLPLTYQRSYAASTSRQTGYITTYISDHPNPDMSIYMAKIATDQGSTPSCPRPKGQPDPWYHIGLIQQQHSTCSGKAKRYLPPTLLLLLPLAPETRVLPAAHSHTSQLRPSPTTTC
jgi:hypothetical protein